MSNHSSAATSAHTEARETLDRDHIRDLVPHAGSMCLLDHVVDWDNASIHCQTRTHLDADNPLRHNGRLSSLCGIEYAAQAMALHGALKLRDARLLAIDDSLTPNGSGERAPRHGYLASVRDVLCASPWLDNHESLLSVCARMLLDEGSRVIYEFELSVTVNSDAARSITGQPGKDRSNVDPQTRILLRGRAAVVLGH